MSEGTNEEVIATIREQIESNPILLYMKGSPAAPQCGFSAQTVQCLIAIGERFAYVDILSNPEIRATLPSYANWPTFPQLYVNGELVGLRLAIRRRAEGHPDRCPRTHPAHRRAGSPRTRSRTPGRAAASRTARCCHWSRRSASE